MSIRDHDQDWRAFGTARDMPAPQSDANRFGPGDVGGGKL